MGDKETDRISFLRAGRMNKVTSECKKMFERKTLTELVRMNEKSRGENSE